MAAKEAARLAAKIRAWAIAIAAAICISGAPAAVHARASASVAAPENSRLGLAGNFAATSVGAERSQAAESPLKSSLAYGDLASDCPYATRGAPKLLAAPRMMNHHLFPQQFRKFFEKAGVKIDDFTVRLSETTHLKGVHGKGVGDLPGGWNARWQQFMEANPNATAKDIYQFGGRLMDEFGLSGLPIVPYPR